jgi:antitoxin component HigA of HigAB toxin-antitoxin module
MRITAVHDSRGEILTLVASPPEAPPAQLELQPGQSMTEIEAPEDMPAIDTPEINERLSELMENYQVDVESIKGTLTTKSEVT